MNITRYSAFHKNESDGSATDNSENDDNTIDCTSAIDLRKSDFWLDLDNENLYKLINFHEELNSLNEHYFLSIKELIWRTKEFEDKNEAFTLHLKFLLETLTDQEVIDSFFETNWSTLNNSNFDKYKKDIVYDDCENMIITKLKIEKAHV